MQVGILRGALTLGIIGGAIAVGIIPGGKYSAGAAASQMTEASANKLHAMRFNRLEADYFNAVKLHIAGDFSCSDRPDGGCWG